MILDFTQWTRLHQHICDAMNWFQEKGLFKGYFDTFRKIASSTTHELSQIREYGDWDKFLEDIPKDNRLPLEFIVNFGNYSRTIDWPQSDKSRLDMEKELADALANGEDKWNNWVNHYTMFGGFDIYTGYHYDPNTFGGIVFIWLKDDKTGIMVDDRYYIPVSVEF